MIALVSCALAAYEAFAYMTRAPKITQLSHRRHTAPLIWGWFFWLGLHFFMEARRDRQEVLRARAVPRR